MLRSQRRTYRSFIVSYSGECKAMSWSKIMFFIAVGIFAISAVAYTQIIVPTTQKISLHYEYPAHKLLKSANAYVYEKNNVVLNFQNDLDLILLGEKHKMVIPQLSAAKFYFTEHFQSAELFVLPICQWITLDTILEQIDHRKALFENIKQHAIAVEEGELQHFTEAYFKNKEWALISKYTLEHYTITFGLKKLNSTEFPQLRAQDYFQMLITIE